MLTVTTLWPPFGPDSAEAIDNIEEAVYTVLAADTPIGLYVEGRIYMGFVPRGSDVPSLTWQLISGPLDYALDGATGLREATFQFDCWARTHREVRRLAEAVLACLSGYSGTVGGVSIQGIFFEDEGDSSVYPAEVIDQRKTYGKRLEARVWYR